MQYKLCHNLSFSFGETLVQKGCIQIIKSQRAEKNGVKYAGNLTSHQ